MPSSTQTLAKFETIPYFMAEHSAFPVLAPHVRIQVQGLLQATCVHIGKGAA